MAAGDAGNGVPRWVSDGMRILERDVAANQARIGAHEASHANDIRKIDSDIERVRTEVRTIAASQARRESRGEFASDLFKVVATCVAIGSSVFAFVWGIWGSAGG